MMMRQARLQLEEMVHWQVSKSKKIYIEQGEKTTRCADRLMELI